MRFGFGFRWKPTLLSSEYGKCKTLKATSLPRLEHLQFKQLANHASCAILEVNNLHGFTNFRTENGSSQRQNLALTVLHVPYTLDSGARIHGGG
jgi:hypothetical protein